MKIDITKKYRTRDGREVIIHSTDGPRRGLPVIASLYTEDGWIPFQWREDGIHPHGQTTDDLIEVREPREWKATVRNATGEIYAYDLGDEDSNKYEVIRVREIID